MPTGRSICGSFLARKGATGEIVYDAAEWRGGLDGCAGAEVREVTPEGFVDWLRGLPTLAAADAAVRGDGLDEELVTDYMESRMARRYATRRHYAAVVLTYDAAATTLPAWTEICRRWQVEVTAKSRGDIYVMSLTHPGDRAPEIVIWDVRPVDRHGLRALAAAAGCDEDEGPLVLPRFLMSTMGRTPELTEADLGGRVITQTGVARCIMRRRVGDLAYEGRRGRRTLAQDYARTARAEEARTYAQYATRRACNRGGLVFVAARDAGQILGRTISIDEVSAHHAAALGHYVPEHFRDATPAQLEAAARAVVGTTVEELLTEPGRWAFPWPASFAGCFVLDGVRLRPDTVWARQEIGIEGHARFAARDAVLGIDAPTAEAAEAGLRAQGYRDEVDGGVFAYGHLMAADRLVVWATDLELWCLSRVYEWDRLTARCGEVAVKHRRPDDEAVLASLEFFDEKQQIKARLRAMPEGDERDRLEEHYVNAVKARFNALGYGLHAQDDYRPGFVVDADGEWHVGDAVTPATFKDRRPKAPRSWYVFGSRISGWARVALVIAAELVHDAFGDEARVVAGDTDSLKIRTDLPVEEVLRALEPLHAAVREGIVLVTERARRMFPDAFHDAPTLGRFEPDGEYAHFYAAWQKAYIGQRDDGTLDITLAGVPRSGEWTLAAWLRMMVDEHGLDIVRRVLCFGARLAAGLSHVETAAYAPGAFPRIEEVDYNMSDATSAETISTVAWQRARGRDVPYDPSAYAGWDHTGRPILVADGDRIWTA